MLVNVGYDTLIAYGSAAAPLIAAQHRLFSAGTRVPFPFATCPVLPPRRAASSTQPPGGRHARQRCFAVQKELPSSPGPARHTPHRFQYAISHEHRTRERGKAVRGADLRQEASAAGCPARKQAASAGESEPVAGSAGLEARCAAGRRRSRLDTHLRTPLVLRSRPLGPS